MKSRIGLRLVVSIVLFSSFITLIVTAIQINSDYRSDLRKIDNYLHLIEESYLQSLGNSLWTYDEKQIQLQLHGLLRLPDMEYLRIESDVGGVWSVGEIRSEHLIRKRFHLTHRRLAGPVTIGTLDLAFSLDNVYGRLIRKTLAILTSNAVKTFLVTGFTLLIFQLLVTRHLTALARWLNREDSGRSGETFHLDRKPARSGRRDELDEVVAAINRMQANLNAQLDDLQDSHALLNAIVDGTSDAIFLKDLEGRYLMANRATLEALGKPLEAVLGQKDADLFPPESAERIEETDAAVMSSGEARLAEETLTTANGTTTYLANKSPYRDGHGRIIGLIGISRDITGLKQAEAEKARLEDQLRQSQKLEAIGTLAGGIAHDFNNILAAIVGYADMARNEISPESPAHRMIDQVLKAGGRATELVQHILAFSRKTDRILGPVRMGSIVKEALKLLRASIPTTIEIHHRIDSETGIILADPTQIHQIVVNLCTNAAQAMEETGGRIEVAVENALLESSESTPGLTAGTYVKLSVHDTGPGIDATHIKNIFDPYFTTKAVGKGSGLGLAVVHGIVRSHGGIIKVESEPAVRPGTTFHLYFPRSEAEAESPPERAEGVPGGSEHILLVDDEPMLVEIGREMLGRLGYTVTTETSSEAALNTFRQDPGRFHLVFTDQTMPHMTGSDLATALLAIRPDLPVILCTGYSSLVDEPEIRRLGIRALVMKPLVKPEVAALIRRVLDENRVTKRN
jgi:PAS domain S-box-containing protein